MNGKPYFVLVMSNRDSTSHVQMSINIDLFDMDWQNRNEYVCGNHLEISGNGKMPKSEKFEEMVQTEKDLSADFPFVRVDLYSIKDKIYFGELTFTQALGLLPYLTDDFNLKMGKKFDIGREVIRK